jgi:hypothetical protein
MQLCSPGLNTGWPVEVMQVHPEQQQADLSQ